MIISLRNVRFSVQGSPKKLITPKKQAKMEKVTFKEYVSSLPNTRDELLKKIAKETKVSPSTVWRWANGLSKPDALKSSVIASLTGLDADVMFK